MMSMEEGDRGGVLPLALLGIFCKDLEWVAMLCVYVPEFYSMVYVLSMQVVGKDGRVGVHEEGSRDIGNSLQSRRSFVRHGKGRS